MSRYMVVVLAVIAVLAGNALLWTTRPTAEPMTPETRSASEKETDLATTASASTSAASRPIPIDPRRPLDLELDSLSLGTSAARFLDDRAGRGNVIAALREEPRFGLELNPRETAPPVDEDSPLHAQLDAPTTASGVRLSDSLRLRGGIGTIEDLKTRDRDYAVGIGIDLIY